MDMLKQLNTAIRYLEGNLRAELNLDEAARLACLTKDSFLRFFSYMTGMTVTEYIRRRRLSLAARDLQESKEKVIEIAGKALTADKAYSLLHQRGDILILLPESGVERFSAGGGVGEDKQTVLRQMIKQGVGSAVENGKKSVERALRDVVIRAFGYSV